MALSVNCPECGMSIDGIKPGCGCPNCGETKLAISAGIQPGMDIGGFIVERKLGAGGMGEVWLATQTQMGRKVALKILSSALASDNNFAVRFMAEVRISAKLMHPNIVTAHAAGNDKGYHYLAMSFIDGTALANMIASGKPLSERRALQIIRQVADALSYAWNDFKIVHRDIKPANIMIDVKGDAKLLDMGISKSLSDNQTMTMTGLLVGTPYYMSPEQAKAEGEVDFHSDIYSLGATLYHAVTGSVPYDASSAIGILMKHTSDPFPSPIAVNPAVSEGCATLLEIMMAKNFVERQKSWEDVIKDIDLVLKNLFPATKRAVVGLSQVMQATPSQLLNHRNVRRDDITPRLAVDNAVDVPSLIAVKSVPPAKKTLNIKLVIAIAVLTLLVVAAFAYICYDNTCKAAAVKARLEQTARDEANKKAAEKARLQAEVEAEAEAKAKREQAEAKAKAEKEQAEAKAKAEKEQAEDFLKYFQQSQSIKEPKANVEK